MSESRYSKAVTETMLRQGMTRSGWIRPEGYRALTRSVGARNWAPSIMTS